MGTAGGGREPVQSLAWAWGFCLWLLNIPAAELKGRGAAMSSLAWPPVFAWQWVCMGVQGQWPWGAPTCPVFPQHHPSRDPSRPPAQGMPPPGGHSSIPDHQRSGGQPRPLPSSSLDSSSQALALQVCTALTGPHSQVGPRGPSRAQVLESP